MNDWFEDITGQKFNRLTVIKRVENRGSRAYWLCKCDCGGYKTTSTTKLRNGYTKSCGCLNVEFNQKRCITHNDRFSRLHNIWGGLKQRCNNVNYKHYKHYGGRGIEVCKEWEESYIVFREWANNNGYSRELTIDRIDNDKGYYPENCRWADRITQMNNRRNNHIVEYNGEILTIDQICRKYNKPYNNVISRLSLGWNIDDAINKEIRNRG